MKISCKQLLMLNKLRIEKGVRWYEVAKGIGCSPENFSHIICGKIGLSLARGKALAAYFGIDWKTLFDDECSCQNCPYCKEIKEKKGANG